MRHTLPVFALLIVLSCNQPSSQKDVGKESDRDSSINTVDSIDETTLPDVNQEASDQTSQEYFDSADESDKESLFELSDTIIADFNGDGRMDKAFFKIEGTTSGVIIAHGGMQKVIRIGFGVPFAHLKEFNWVDQWGLSTDSKSFEIIVEDAMVMGDREVILENPSIFLRKEEAGGGLITFKNGKYVWIHQSC